MSRPKILQEGQSYTFRSYFELPYEPEDILAELGYALKISELTLPSSDRPLPQLKTLHHNIRTILPLVSLSSETARRETLVAPILMEVARVCNSPLRIEYPLTVSNWLKGTLDYLLRSNHNLLVVEAKKDDMTRGFTQLAAELIALSQVEEQDLLYGAVTIGNVWQFAQLDNSQHMITQGIQIYAVPDDLEKLVQILVGILLDENG